VAQKIDVRDARKVCDKRNERKPTYASDACNSQNALQKSSLRCVAYYAYIALRGVFYVGCKPARLYVYVFPSPHGLQCCASVTRHNTS